MMLAKVFLVAVYCGVFTLSLLSTEEYRQLGELFLTIDVDSNHAVTQEELVKWILYTRAHQNFIHAEGQFAANDRNDDGFVTWEERLEAFWDVHKADNEDGQQQEERRFELANMDDEEHQKKKGLNLGEFFAFLYPADNDYMKEKILAQTWQEMDTNKDNLISKDEYLDDVVVGPKQDGVSEPVWLRQERERFSGSRDKNLDGYLDKDEVKQWIFPKEHVADEAVFLIKESDADQDGLLSKDEMIGNFHLFEKLYDQELMAHSLPGRQVHEEL